MRIKNSVLKKVFLIFAGFSLFQALLFYSASIFLAYAIEDALITRLLNTEVEYIQDTYSKTGNVVTPRNAFVSLYKVKEEAPTLIRESYNEARISGEIFSPDDEHHYHYKTIPLSDSLRPFIVADVTDVLSVRHAFREFFLISGIVLFLSIVISLVLSFNLARYTTRPLLNLAYNVAGRQNQSKNEIDVNDEDELSYLARVTSEAFDQREIALHRERDFNRDLSHELRTPLTIMNNTLSLSESRALKTQEIEQMKATTSNMVRIVEAVLGLARHESTLKTEFSLRKLIEDVVLSIYPVIEAKAFDLELYIGDKFVVGNESLAKLVIKNLIENAMAYSSDNRLSIRQHDNTLVFLNNANRKAPSDLTEPNAREKESLGIGHGLYLSKRILDSLGWGYEYESTEDEFRFTILL